MIKDNSIICGDCLDVMRDIPDKSIDLVLTDPPYGINCAGGVGGGVSKGKKYEDDWDNNTPTKKLFDELLRIGKNVIIFGGNFFTDKLPVNGHWIVWDKVGEIKFDNPYSGAELAWTNIQKNTVKKYVVIQAGFIAKEKQRFHPTQKPVELFKNILLDYSEENDLILDPFFGSGTTAIACQELHRRFIGIEINQKYCDIARDRLKQQPLF